LIDLAQLETGDFDWAVELDDFLHLQFELFEIPFSPLLKSIQREAHESKLDIIQVIDSDAGDCRKPRPLGCLDPDNAIDYVFVLVD
jgi:hypothetical protein